MASGTDDPGRQVETICLLSVPLSLMAVEGGRLGEGRVLIHETESGGVGTVCAAHFDRTAGQLVCHQLGYADIDKGMVFYAITQYTAYENR